MAVVGTDEIMIERGGTLYKASVSEAVNATNVVSSITSFGAVGDWDGTTGTDNTAALQSAINAMAALGVNARKALYVPHGRYMFSELFIPTEAAGLSFTGDGKRSSQLKSTKTTAGPSIDVDTTGLQFINVGLEGGGNDGATQNIIVRVKRQIGKVADLDVYFEDCTLTNSYYLAQTWGRGAVFSGGYWSLARYGWDIQWPADGDYVEGPEWHQKKSTGFRRLVVENVEVHALQVDAVRNEGANAINAQITMRGVFSEIGDGLFVGKLGKGSRLDDNRSTGVTGPSMSITGGNDYVIDGVSLSGTLEAGQTGAATNLIRLTGDHTNPAIVNGSFGYCKEHAIDVRSGTVTGAIFSDLDFIQPCLDGGDFNPIIFVGSGHTAEISDIRLRSTANLDAIVRTTDAGAAVNVQRAYHLFGGTTPPIKGGGTTAAEYLTNNTGTKRIRVSGSGSPEGVVSAQVGSEYRDYFNGTTYVKKTGVGTNTGWLAVATV